MKRGEVWWVSFDPSIGGEIQKTRPAVIISNNNANRTLNRVQVMPLSAQISKIYPSETLVTCNNIQHKVPADQITTVSKQRFRDYYGRLSDDDMANIEIIIKIHFDIR
jgi:mRNA interferase MazF